MKERSVILCNTSRGCCPILTLSDNDTVCIKDDDDNVVNMTIEQAMMISDKLSSLLVEEVTLTPIDTEED